MRPIRILFANSVSPLARGLLGEMFTGRTDMEVVTADAGARGARRHDVDVVISEIDDVAGDSVWPPALFGESSRNRLAVTINGARVMLFEIHPHYPALSDPSPDSLIAAIRGAVGGWKT